MTFAENVLRVYDAATPAQIAAGMEWYDSAHELALTLSPGDVWRGAGVIACYSPMQKWERNVELATLSLNSGVAFPNYLPPMVKCAQRILDGEFTLDVLNGDKTRAFAAAIADPAGSTIATIDRHAHDIAQGRVFTDKERKIGKVLFRTMSNHYVQAALEIGIGVAQLQAATWVAWREGVRP